MPLSFDLWATISIISTQSAKSCVTQPQSLFPADDASCLRTLSLQLGKRVKHFTLQKVLFCLAATLRGTRKTELPQESNQPHQFSGKETHKRVLGQKTFDHHLYHSTSWALYHFRQSSCRSGLTKHNADKHSTILLQSGWSITGMLVSSVEQSYQALQLCHHVHMELFLERSVLSYILVLYLALHLGRRQGHRLCPAQD